MHSDNKQNECITKQIESLKKNRTEILEMKNSVKQINNELLSSGNRADQMVEIIIYMEDRNLEMMLRENEKDLSMKI